MPSFENPPPAEGINYSAEHPLKEFFQLLIGITAVLIAGIIILNFTVGALAKHIPFAFEQSMVKDLDALQVEESEQQQYLQRLADKLSANMALDEQIEITVHYSDADALNAFATIGGNVFFFNGLISEMQSEQELAAVMAHEIAHIQHRHPIVALGKGITLATLAAFISGSSGSTAGDWLIGSSINLSLLQFSRDQERAADATAAQALFETYGNISGAEQLFRRFSELEKQLDNHSESHGGTLQGAEKNSEPFTRTEIFRSHPYSVNRWQAVKKLAVENAWPTKGELTQLNFPFESSGDK